MDGFTIGAVIAGLTTTGILFFGNLTFRSILIPKYKQLTYDGPKFEGIWHADITGEANEQFSAELEIKHYSPYLRGTLSTTKTKAGRTVAVSNLKITGYFCDGYFALSCRTSMKSRRSICVLILKICAQSKNLKGTYVFRALNSGELISHPVEFQRLPGRQ
ncbi:MAG: hypothetical protein AAF709_25015 [Pseudomonadota bacterium]